VRVESVRFHRGEALVKLAGVETMDQADALRGLVLGLRVRDLPPLADSEYYHHQLEGLDVLDAQGVVLGRVASVRDNPGHDLLVVVPSDGDSGAFMVPLVEAFVREVDLGRRRIVVDLPAGLAESQR